MKKYHGVALLGRTWQLDWEDEMEQCNLLLDGLLEWR